MPQSESDSPTLAEVEIDIVQEAEGWPQDIAASAEQAVQAAFAVAQDKPQALTISLSDDAHLAQLNAQFRDKAGPTNVLSFPFEGPLGEDAYLGDIAIAYETVAKEAKAEGLSIADRTAHMVVHGVLHLLGHDHLEDGEAEVMEALETAALATLGIKNPYDLENGE